MDTWARSQDSPSGISGGRSGTGARFYWRTSFFVSIIPPIIHCHRNVHIALTRMTNGRSLGTFQRKKCDLSEFGKHWVQKYLNTFLAFRELNEIVFCSLLQWPLWHNLEYTMKMMMIIIIVMTDEMRLRIEIIDCSIAACITLLRLRENVTLKHVLQSYYIVRTRTRAHTHSM